MGIQDYVQALRRHVLLVLVCVAVGLVLAGLSVARSHTSYSSSGSILVTGSEPSQDLNQIAANRISSYLAVARSDLVAAKVSSALTGVIDPGATYSISASNPTGTSIIDIKVKARSAAVAQRVTQAVITQVVAVVHDLEVSANKGGQPVSTLVPIGQASVPKKENPSRNLIVLLGAGIGLFFGVAGALLRHGMDHSLRSVDDAEAQLGVRVLGAVPRLRRSSSKRSFVTHDPSAIEAVEAFRKMVARLRHGLGAGQHRILVTSSVTGEGVSTVSRNLAAALANSGSPTILIAAELPHDNPLGPPALTAGDSEEDGDDGQAKAIHVWHPSGGRDQLRVITMPNGTAADAEADKANWVIDVLTEVSTPKHTGAASIVVDSSAAIESADAEVIAGHCTDVIVVVEGDATQRKVVRRTLAVFRAIDAPVVGLVLNARHRKRRWGGIRRRRTVRTGPTPSRPE